MFLPPLFTIAAADRVGITYGTRRELGAPPSSAGQRRRPFNSDFEIRGPLRSKKGPMVAYGTRSRLRPLAVYAAWLIIHRPSAPNNAADPIASSDTQITPRRTKSTPVVASIVPSFLCALKDVAD